MAIGIFIIVIVVLGLLLLLKFNHLKHKIIGFVLILLLLFFYFSFSAVVRDNDVEFNGVGSVVKATGLYFSWIGHSFNLRTITGNVVGMDWGNNDSDEYMVG